MTIKKRTLLSALVFLLLAAACTPAPPADDTLVMDTFSRNGDGYADISVDQLVDLMEQQDVTLVNVHIPYAGEIPGTDAHIPYDDIASYLDELPAQDAPIVLYCRSGSMSTSAAEELVELGYTNVAEVDGGMVAWEGSGRELLTR